MIKTFLKMLMGLMVFASAAVAAAQSVVTAQFAGTSVNLVIPKGHCIIPRDDELGALHYQLQEDGNRGRNKVAILFADCGEWAKRKANPELLLTNHGNYLFQLTRNQELLLPSTTTRADLVETYVKHELKNRGSSQEITELIKQKLASSSVTSATVKGNFNLGLIDRDEQRGAYMGVGGTFVYEGRPVRFVGVSAVTIARAVPVAINLYGPAAKGNPFQDLLVKQKDNLRQFIAANE